MPSFITAVLDSWVRALRSIPDTYLAPAELILRELLAGNRAFTRASAVTIEDFAQRFLNDDDNMPGITYHTFASSAERFRTLTAKLKNDGLRNLDTNTLKSRLPELDERRRCKIMVGKIKKVLAAAKNKLRDKLVLIEDCPLYIASVRISNTGHERGYVIPVTKDIIEEVRGTNSRKSKKFESYVRALDHMLQATTDGAA